MFKFMKLAGLAFSSVFIASVSHAQIIVADPWVRATVPQQTGTGAFMKLTSEKDTTLVAADSPVAEHVEVHEMVMENNVMKMREVAGVPLSAEQTVELKPGGYHIMFIDLHQQVKEGEQVPLTLTFEGADGVRSSLEVLAPVKPLTTPARGHGHSGHTGHSAGSTQGGHGEGTSGHGHGSAKH